MLIVPPGDTSVINNSVLHTNDSLAHRRQALGLTLKDVHSFLSEHGFNYSIDMLQAMERGERRLPLAPGFVVAMSQCLRMPVTQMWQAAHVTSMSMRSHNVFWNKVQRLRPQNQVLLRLILRYPVLTEIPGFDLWFKIAKSIALKLPDHWFSGE
jgi:hypothetical protein